MGYKRGRVAGVGRTVGVGGGGGEGNGLVGAPGNDA